MAELKLGKLPERAPVRLTVHLTPELSRDLDDYAAAYERAYGRRESVGDLVPFMIERFLASDREFARSRKTK